MKYKLEGKTYKLKIADNELEWQEGLMNEKKAKGFDGMIFIFPDKQIRTFWNKNTFLELRIYWLNDDKVVGKATLPSIDKSKNIVSVQSPEPVNKVVELISK